jgi:hypothetical protein|tara:strand:- start:379 stop:708 length:330 start_codon:yes stop_codon:yes gene_type:complete
MKTKAILIDPNLPRISVERVDGFEDIQRMIDCRCFTCVRFPDGKHVAYVDDEGLINGTKLGVKFIDSIYPDALAGKILILADDGHGGDADCELTGSDIQAMVKGIVQFS